MTIADSVTDRVRGLLLGAACAEALGAPFTGARWVPRAQRDDWCTSPRPLRYTAGTASMLALADHLSSTAPTHRVCEQDIGVGLGAMWAREPWRGYGPAETSALRMLRGGARWQDACRATYPNGSFSTGAAIRVGPVGMLDDDLDRLAALARTSARPTHAHELGQDGAAAHAVAVALAATTPADHPIDPTTFLEQIARRATTSLFEEAFNRARGVIGRGDAGAVARRVGTAPTAWESVPAALVAFLRHPASYVDGVRFALSMGGATGPIAAMTGALGGARGGVGAIPLVWLARLENAPLICAAADDLARTIDGAATLPRTTSGRHATVPPFLY